MKLTYPFGATPLEPDELDQLILDISTQAELNDYERANIEKALEWARKSRFLKSELLTTTGLLRLHKEMFAEVWRWAGQIRNSEKNIGVAPHNIYTQLSGLCSDVKYWIENNTYEMEELATRFHHRLVAIHPFTNGNGRHSRIAADLLLEFRKCRPLSWGINYYDDVELARKDYIQALRAADQGDYALLIQFSKR